ncbi:hypothetical protein EVAR_27704_1 [Eumeta japonica]|uniref:Uncharacterized protein n=1 Tax=Eumeta variegata TaxID=151549 RepID=A0A4C1WNB3_EUMVA|nr:hypothetical protein EVAR_27704_1 [Eumeta japonica]
MPSDYTGIPAGSVLSSKVLMANYLRQLKFIVTPRGVPVTHLSLSKSLITALAFCVNNDLPAHGVRRARASAAAGRAAGGRLERKGIRLNFDNFGDERQ